MADFRGNTGQQTEIVERLIIDATSRTSENLNPGQATAPVLLDLDQIGHGLKQDQPLISSVRLNEEPVLYADPEGITGRGLVQIDSESSVEAIRPQA